MSFIHYLFLGHFEHDGDVVRFAKSPRDGAYWPVIRRPLDPEAIKAVLRQVKGADVEELAFPDDWRIWWEDGYLVCDKYTRNPEAINFVTHLVERTGCDIHDVSAHRDIPLSDWLAAMRCYAKPGLDGDPGVRSGGGGIRTPRETPEKTALSPEGGAKSGALPTEPNISDPDLARIIVAWPDLPDHIRAAVLALVGTVG
jgi:hypothetical protein